MSWVKNYGFDLDFLTMAAVGEMEILLLPSPAAVAAIGGMIFCLGCPAPAPCQCPAVLCFLCPWWPVAERVPLPVLPLPLPLPLLTCLDSFVFLLQLLGAFWSVPLFESMSNFETSSGSMFSRRGMYLEQESFFSKGEGEGGNVMVNIQVYPCWHQLQVVWYQHPVYQNWRGIVISTQCHS